MKEKALTIAKYTVAVIGGAAIIYVVTALENGSWTFFKDNKKEMPAEAKQQSKEYAECVMAYGKAFKQAIEQWKENPSEQNRLRVLKVKYEANECNKILDEKYFRYDKTLDAFVYREWFNHKNK